MKHTHSLIRNRLLRNVYAKELAAGRRLRSMDDEYFSGFLFGMESGFWAMQQALTRLNLFKQLQWRLKRRKQPAR